MLGRINHESMTGPQLGRAREHGQPAACAHLELRLTYPLGHRSRCSCAIGVFVAASSGQRFLASLSKGRSPRDRGAERQRGGGPPRGGAAALRRRRAGRHYKEVICEAEGHAQIERLMGDSRDEQLLEDARDLLVALGRGNPTHALAVHRCVLSLLGSANTVTQRLACGLRTLLPRRGAEEQPQIVDVVR